MTGFIIIFGSSADFNSIDRFSVPGIKLEEMMQRTIGNELTFIGWGQELGDIHVSIGIESSILILNGYISETPFIQNLSNQQQICNELHSYLAKDNINNNIIERMKNFMQEAKGSFSLVYIDSKKGDVVICMDRIAARPIWYKRSGRSCLISSHATAIAQILAKPKYDLGALASLLLYGCQMDPSFSLFSGVRAVREGTIIAFSSDQEPTIIRWYKFKHSPEKRLSCRGWVDLISTCLKEAARRTLEVSPNPIVFLSGGLDSRLTTAALYAAGGRPKLVTISDSENLEVRIAKKVAAALSCNHEIVLRDKHWYFPTLHRSVFETSGSYIWTHGHFSRAFADLNNKIEIKSAFLGSGCEAFSNFVVEVDPKRFKVLNRENFVKEFDLILPNKYRPQTRELTLKLLKPIARKEAEIQLKKRIAERFNEIREGSSDPLIIASQFLDWEAVTTHPAFFNNLDLRSAGPERALMFDPEAHGLLEILPASMRNRQNLGAQLIRKISPSAAKILNSNTLLPIDAPIYLQDFAKTLRPLLGKLWRKMFGNTYRTMGSWSNIYILFREDSIWKRFIEKNLFEEWQSDDIFDINAIRTCWEAFCKGDTRRSQDIERLIEIKILNSLCIR